MGSKNNPHNRGKGAKKKELNGKVLEPVKYFGKNVGHGNYIAAKITKSTDVVLDSNGKPVPWDEI